MRKLVAFFVLAAAAAFGCMKIDQEITFNADGTAEVKIHYAMSEQSITQMEAMQKGNPDGDGAQKGLPFDEKKIREDFKSDDARAELKDVKVESKDGWRHVNITLACKDLGKAAEAGGDDNQTSLLKDAAGNYVLTMKGGKLGEMGGGADVPAEQKAQQQAMMKAMMAGFRMSIKYTLPGDVVETNAHKTEGRSVSWILDLADEKFFEKSEQLGKDGMKVVFKGAGLNLKEFKPAPPPVEPAPGKDAEPE